jgi:D-beta-D-heptose 7-phosphate kinase/D-beta-D-heptose 1-phosphate adenosyltransferase
MNPRSAEAILSAGRGKAIVVVGDLILDQFVWGTVDRISPEAPVPVVKTTRESYHLGGAGNVAHNIKALGGVPRPVGVIGEGPFAARMLEAMAQESIDASGVVKVRDRITTVKTRVVAHSQQVVRFDREQDDALDDAATARLIEAAARLLDSAGALVISDYEKGCVTPRLLAELLPAARQRGLPVLVDPKPAHWRSYGPVTVIAPNVSEAARMSGVRIRGDEDLVEAGLAIRKTLDCRAVLLTRGEKGMLLLEEGSEPFAIQATSREVFDVTGAGDTVVAALAVGLAAGASLRDAAVIANLAAGVVVGKVGTAVASPAEVLAALAGGGARGRGEGGDR